MAMDAQPAAGEPNSSPVSMKAKERKAMRRAVPRLAVAQARRGGDGVLAAEEGATGSLSRLSLQPTLSRFPVLSRAMCRLQWFCSLFLVLSRPIRCLE